jgi:hypothetical protein
VYGERECIQYDSTTKLVAIEKQGTGAQTLNPTNFTVQDLKFYVRPTQDPYGNTHPKTEPFVTMVITFQVKIGADNPVIIPYQTTISTDLYDIPQ